MSVHVFVDESQRVRYTICAAVVSPDDLRAVRRELRGMLLPRQGRLHFVNESTQRRRVLLDAMRELPVRTRLYTSAEKEPIARQRAMEALLVDMRALGGQRLVIECRECEPRRTGAPPDSDSRPARRSPGGSVVRPLSGAGRAAAVGVRRRGLGLRRRPTMASQSRTADRPCPRCRRVPPRRAKARPLTVRGGTGLHFRGLVPSAHSLSSTSPRKSTERGAFVVTSRRIRTDSARGWTRAAAYEALAG